MTIKEELKTIAENLNQDATWDDVLYEIQVRQKISNGLKAVKEGRMLSHDAVRRMYSH